MTNKDSDKTILKEVEQYGSTLFKFPPWFFIYGLSANFSKKDVPEEFRKRKEGALNEIKNAQLSHDKLMEILAEKIVLLDEIGLRSSIMEFPLLELPKEIKDAWETAKHEAVKADKSEHGKKAAKARLNKDPKQAAKSDVLSWWKKWQRNPALYTSKAHFARVMLDKHDGVLKSQKKIEDWCREWEKRT